MIIVDTEYTTWPGSLERGWSEEGEHREIVQVSAIRTDDLFNEIEAFDVLVRPTHNPVLSNLFKELTGITQEDVDRNGIAWAEAVSKFLRFANTDTIICMNGDGAVFRENQKLNNLADDDLPLFHRLRPFLEKSGVDLDGLSSGDLHTLTPSPIVGHTHNALHDVRSMAVWLKHSDFTIISDLPTEIPDIDPRQKRSLNPPRQRY